MALDGAIRTLRRCAIEALGSVQLKL